MKLKTVCPYCAHSFKHEFDEPLDVEEYVECPKCQKTYCCEVTVVVTVEEYPCEQEVK